MHFGSLWRNPTQATDSRLGKNGERSWRQGAAQEKGEAPPGQILAVFEKSLQGLWAPNLQFGEIQAGARLFCENFVK